MSHRKGCVRCTEHQWKSNKTEKEKQPLDLIAGRSFLTLTRWKFQSVQFSSVAQLCPTLRGPMNRCTPGLPVHHQLPESPKLMSIESVMPSSLCRLLILYRSLLLLPPIPPSIRVFSNESTLRIRWPKYWSFFSIIPSKEHPGLISFRMDWLDLLTVQGTLKSDIIWVLEFLSPQLVCGIRINHQRS